MNITAVRYFSNKDLVARLRLVTMLNDKTVKPYQNAEIQITDIDTKDLAPAQLYVLRSEFEKVRDLRWALQAFAATNGLAPDILRIGSSRVFNGTLVSADTKPSEMLGFMEFDIVEEGENGAQSEAQTITILPPIVEVSKEADGTLLNIINDGMHRCYLARISRMIPSVVKIRGVPEHLPYYAFPTPNGWGDVTMVDKLSPTLLKKHHRFPAPNYKEYYRDFNSAFKNVGGPRGDGRKKKPATPPAPSACPA